MYSDEDYSLTNVVRHVKYFIQKLQPKQNLTLEYKFAKVNQLVEGNKKFQQILDSSEEDIIIMNANRQIKRDSYVHLKSMTFLDEFNRFQDNLQTLKTIHDFQVIRKQKVDLTVIKEKISFDCSNGAWTYKNRWHLFSPCYEGVKDRQLFRIGLIKQVDGEFTPNKKVTEMIQKTKKKAIKEEKQQPYVGKYGGNKKIEQKIDQNSQTNSTQKSILHDPRDNREAPFRFKMQQTYHLSKCCSLVMTTVYQAKLPHLYEQMSTYVKNGNIFPQAITNKCKQIFKNMKDELAYEVEFRFDPKFMREMGDMQQEEIEEVMRAGVSVMLELVKDQVEFCGEQVVKWLDVIDGN